MQALQQLKEKLPIERARMRLKIQLPVTCRTDLIQLLAGQQATVESEDLAMHNSQVTTQLCGTLWTIKIHQASLLHRANVLPSSAIIR